MKRLMAAVVTLALFLGAHTVKADPVFGTGDLYGAYTLNASGLSADGGAFSGTGVIRFDGVGHIVNTTATPSYAISYLMAAPKVGVPNGPAQQCRFNMRTPTLAEIAGLGNNLYTVSPLDSSIRIPVFFMAFGSQPPACQARNGKTSIISGTMTNPSNGSLIMNATGLTLFGTLTKQSQTP